MTTFDQWCDKKQVKHWREAFYHYLMAQGFTSWTDEEALERKWHNFLADALLSLSKTLRRLKEAAEL